MGKSGTRMAAVALAVALAVTAAVAQEKASGKVNLQSKSVALGIGVSWGDGTLEYAGKKHPFTVKGLSIVDLGVAKVTATGEVFNLKKLSDFEGNYAAGEASAALGGGAGITVMKNQHGVVMRLKSTEQGVQLTLAGQGVEVKMKK